MSEIFHPKSFGCPIPRLDDGLTEEADPEQYRPTVALLYLLSFPVKARTNLPDHLIYRRVREAMIRT